MVAGRLTEPIDARIHDDVVCVLRHYDLRVMAAREAGHRTHGDGIAVDSCARSPRPTTTGTPRPRDSRTTSAGPGPGAGSGARPACLLKPAIQWVGFDGYPDHGSPRTCTGGWPAHIHVSWVSDCRGSGTLVAPCAWVMAFPVPPEGERGDVTHDGERANATTPPGWAQHKVRRRA